MSTSKKCCLSLWVTIKLPFHRLDVGDLLAEPDAADDQVVPVDEDGLDLRPVEQLRVPDWVDEDVPHDLQGLEKVLLGRQQLHDDVGALRVDGGGGDDGDRCCERTGVMFSDLVSDEVF